MPPRRSHKKSRQGCVQCKARRIKCDEVRPRCGNCKKHAITCAFEGNKTPPSSETAPAPPIQKRATSPQGSETTCFAMTLSFACSRPSPSLSSPGLNDCNVRQPPSLRLLDMQLFHHFTVVTAEATVDKPVPRYFFTEVIPSLAFQNSCAMDAILALSALHLTFLKPTERKYVEATYRHMSSALSQYQELLNRGINFENAQVIYLVAIFVSFHSTISPLAAPATGDAGASRLPPWHWFRHFQGLSTVLRAAMPYIQGDTAIPQFSLPLLKGADGADPGELPLHFLLDDMHDSVDESVRGAYESAVSVLSMGFRNPRHRYLPIFLATVSPKFVSLVRAHDPRSLVIVAAHFSMARAQGREWFLERLVQDELQRIKDVVPASWSLVLEKVLALTEEKTNEVLATAESERSNATSSPFRLWF